MSCTSHPCEECGINSNVMRRLGKEARAERERRIRLPEVTGEVIHEESSLQEGGKQQEARGETKGDGLLKQERNLKVNR